MPNAVGWIKAPYHIRLPDKLGALLSHPSTAGQIEPALKLAKGLLAIEPDPQMSKEANEEDTYLLPKSQPLFDLWHYEQILKRNVPNLVTAAGDESLKFLCGLLGAAVRLSEKAGENRGPDDYSYIWRPNIEHSHHMEEGVRGLLVSAVRDAALQSGQQDPTKIPEIIQKLEARKRSVFHRIALDVLRVFAERAPALIAERLTDPKRFDSSHFCREYNRLCKEQFAQLPPQDRDRILDWIEKGPDIDKFKTTWDAYHGNPPTAPQIEDYSKTWQRDRLHPISNDLPDAWKRRYENLVSSVGTAESDEPDSHDVAAWYGPSTPKKAEDLRAMDAPATVCRSTSSLISC